MSRAQCKGTGRNSVWESMARSEGPRNSVFVGREKGRAEPRSGNLVPKTLLDKPRGESYHDALPALISTRSGLFFRAQQGQEGAEAANNGESRHHRLPMGGRR